WRRRRIYGMAGASWRMMRMRWKSVATGVLLAGGVAVNAAQGAEPSAEAIAQLPPPAARTVDFARDIQPLLEASCVKCHGRGKAKGDWRLDTRETLLSPGSSGVSVVPGDSAKSRLIHLVAGTDPDDVMPQKGTKLTPEQVGLLRAWVDQSAPWPAEVTFARPPDRNLQPRQPELPASGPEHPVDRLLSRYLERHGAAAQPPAVDDRLFARRVFLDTIGLLPTPEELDAFAADPASDKRSRLVRRLLDDRQRYAQHWLTFWNDLLRNDYRGTGYIDGGRQQISAWLYAGLRDNKPYDQFVRELVNPTADSEGFSKGIVWRGTVNASMTPSMQAAQNIGQVFMGVNLKCASCHDSFIDDWQLADAYGLAGIYSEERLEMVQCDKPIGKVAPLKFLFPELGAVDASAPRAQRLEQLAGIITQPKNGRLSRTVVNRLWARLLGRGLVEPLDVMQNPAWDPDLLDFLAEDLVSHQWDLKRTLELILTSRAYQMPTVSVPEKPEEDYVFLGPAIRRLTAEQFRDALGTLTGVWQERPEGGLDALLVERGSEAPLPVDAQWIWSDPHGASGVPPSTNWFRREWVLAAVPAEASLHVQADNRARVFLNGTRLRGGEASDWSEPAVYDLRPQLTAGTNVLLLEAVNGGDGPNPAGVLAYLRIRSGSQPGSDFTNAVLDLTTDAAWQTTAQVADPAHPPGPEAWRPAQVLGPVGIEPWKAGSALALSVSGRPVYGQVRASLTAADPLMLALGRPNREQVTTVRQSTATTIQALELTNGDSLSRLLHQGAERLVATNASGPALARQVFAQALSRPPTPRELDLAVGLIGSQPKAESVEDFLWGVTLLPEFQLVY
ncbi:MAG: DUF1549 domain-containing protein, partial [Verrucomicrobiae bacterium]|nr:DUF1549 domain-containing protein [Verrucomicrobiae bacterium]